MNVHVNETGQHVHSCGINLMIGILRLPVLSHLSARRARSLNGFYPIVLDDYVYRAKGRRARSINQNSPANDQSLKRAASFIRLSIRRGNDLWLLLLRAGLRGRLLRLSED
jgi:hypothetical protein